MALLEIPATSNSFLRGAARLLACETVIAELIESLGDIIVLDEEGRMYEPRPGLVDIGSTRTGLQIIQDATWASSGMVKTTIAEFHPQQIIGSWYEGLSTLICMMQRPDKTIRSIIFYNVQLQPMEMHVPWRGEAMATPVAWTYRDVVIIDQLSPV